MVNPSTKEYILDSIYVVFWADTRKHYYKVIKDSYWNYALQDIHNSSIYAFPFLDKHYIKYHEEFARLNIIED